MAAVWKLAFLLFATALLAVQAEKTCEVAEYQGPGTCADAGKCPEDTDETPGMDTCDNDQVCCVYTFFKKHQVCGRSGKIGLCTDAKKCTKETKENTENCDEGQVCCLAMKLGLKVCKNVGGECVQPTDCKGKPLEANDCLANGQVCCV